MDGRECSIISVRGSGPHVGAGFGVMSTGVPRTGTSGDAGADAAHFNPGENPTPICGTVAKIPGGTVNVASELLTATSAGLPVVFSNGSIAMTFFQVNREGGGPLTCQVSPDATGNSWQPMDITLNVPGNFGIQPANRVQYTAIATFRAGARLIGGATKNVGLIRCRAGVNNQCGGCFAVQMNGQVVKANSHQSSVDSDTELSLTSQQMSTLMAKVVDVAKEQGMVAPA